MKTTNIVYWTSTGLFGAFMIFSAIPHIMVTAESVEFINNLGYPTYIIPFLGVAKFLGGVAILIPGFVRLKEWAYAGLFYDLLGATYSVIASTGFQPSTAFMLLPFALFALSYVYYHKRLRQSKTNLVENTAPVAG